MGGHKYFMFLQQHFLLERTSWWLFFCRQQTKLSLGGEGASQEFTLKASGAGRLVVEASTEHLQYHEPAEEGNS
jgi:hypothetical protein